MRHLDNIDPVVLWHVQDDVVPNRPDSHAFAEFRTSLSQKRILSKPLEAVQKLLAKSFDAQRTLPLNSELTRHVHGQIFGDLYEWAGRWRTVNISKPGITWPPPEFIDENMTRWEQGFLRKYPATQLGDDDDFCAAVAQIQGAFLVIHPFREGNARTIKLLTDLLAAQTGRPLLKYEQSDMGRDQYIQAASQAFRRIYAPKIAVIQQALIAAKQGPSAAP